jgi:hypothetical protein
VKLHRNAKTTPHMRALLVDRIQHQQWTPLAAASAAGISVRSAYTWLARHRTGGAVPLEERASTPHHQPRRTPPAVTARIIAARDERVRGIGWEYAHVAIDDHSRAAYVEVLPDQTDATTAAFLQRTVAWFARRGVRIARVEGQRWQLLQSAVSGRGRSSSLRLKRARPYRPQTSGKAERFIQTLLREWAYARPYENSARRTRALRP